MGSTTNLVHTLGKTALCILCLFTLWLMLVFSISIVSIIAFGATLFGVIVVTALFVWQLMNIIEIAVRWKK